VTAVGEGLVAILLGPPGVGKGTQGVLLAERAGLHHLSTGDILRKNRKEGTDLGREAQAYMDRGELVPDPLILDMVRTTLTALEPGEGVVFDGFPRTEVQARRLGPVLEGLGRRVDLVIVLEADDEVIVRRLTGRRSCPSCGAVYNVYTNPPAEEGRCDRCGAGLVHREDDQPETVRRRLEVYRAETEPLILHYEEGPATVVLVGGEGGVEDAQSEIRSAVDAARTVRGKQARDLT
jgi:adenylate kinase